MARPSLPSLGGLTSLPADAIAALHRLPEIADNTRAMKEHTAALQQVAEALDRVAADTDALPAMRQDMERIGALPETLDRLDKGIERLSELMEMILKGLDGMNASVETLQGAVSPLASLAGRVPGRKKG